MHTWMPSVLLVRAGSVTQLCLTLCDSMGYSLPGFSIHGIFQARILEWVTMTPPGDLPHPGIEPSSLTSPALAGGFFTTTPPGKPNVLLGLQLFNSLNSEVTSLGVALGNSQT